MEIDSTQIEELAAQMATDRLLKSQAFWDFVAGKIAAHAYNAMRMESEGNAHSALQRAEADFQAKLTAATDRLTAAFERRLADVSSQVNLSLLAAWDGMKPQVNDALHKAIRKATDEIVRTHLSARIEALVKKLVD